MSEVPLPRSVGARDGTDLDLDPEWIWIWFFSQELSGTTIWIWKKVSDPDSTYGVPVQGLCAPTEASVSAQGYEQRQWLQLPSKGGLVLA